MKVGCVKEIKNNEFRVGMTPDNAKSYVNAGHEVYIEKGAGIGSGFSVKTDPDISPWIGGIGLIKCLYLWKNQESLAGRQMISFFSNMVLTFSF